MNQTPIHTDLVSELLSGMRLVGIDYRRIELAPPFSVSFGENDARGKFLFVAGGSISLTSPDGATHAMHTGDAALLPRGGLHRIASSDEPGCACRDLSTFKTAPLCPMVSEIRVPDAAAAGPDRTADDAAAGDRVVLFSACMDFELGSMHPLIGLMPAVMRVGTLIDRYPEILPMLEAMEREARHARAGYAGILSRLADVVAASIVRGWVECGCGDATGWIAALRDPRLGRVLLALHRDPGRAWTVAELASQMGASRSVFAERFLEVTGVTPVRYLTELRMRLASDWIARDRMPIDTAAQKLGYASHAAFSRAFKRIMGHPPGRAAVLQASRVA
ncbi:AraC family transcriptional regulator [Hoeflea marina]|uniref:AraC family transcriptional regulator n=1 Tax=Hoeflea marina TaxID=274592 RepID=A0A317PR17_9HYPH|nr:AraC family transcriptional regulator [Hoeflea marina]PWW03931.1 AraC family transcriptional regulator [Hoeflea marina]